MPLATPQAAIQPLQPMPSEPSPASPVVQTLDNADDEDIAEDQPMPAQPLLPARRLRQPSIAEPMTAAQALAEPAPVAVPEVETPAEARAEVVPVAPATEVMRITTMRSMRISCSSSWRRMSMRSSGYGLQM